MVVNAATPVLMPWLAEVDAVLWAGLPGQEGGHAVAAALLGDIEPAGRLVTTFPVADGATPAWSVTPVDGNLAYAEGTFIGYRGHYAGRAPAPAFWFGHGLGYSTWAYGPATLLGGSRAVVRSTVTNTGARPSREVVQVYLRAGRGGPAGAAGRLDGRHGRAGPDRAGAGGHRPAAVAAVDGRRLGAAPAWRPPDRRPRPRRHPHRRRTLTRRRPLTHLGR